MRKIIIDVNNVEFLSTEMFQDCKKVGMRRVLLLLLLPTPPLC